MEYEPSPVSVWITWYHWSVPLSCGVGEHIDDLVEIGIQIGPINISVLPQLFWRHQ